MRISYRLTDRKSRLLTGIANFSLAAGLILWVFVHPANQTTDSLRHFFAGLLLGLSVTINLFRMIRWNAPARKL
jgi:hypothetical protein